MKKTLNTLAAGVLMMASVSAFAANTDQAKISIENGYTTSGKGSASFSYDLAQNAREAVCTVLGPLGLQSCKGK